MHRAHVYPVRVAEDLAATVDLFRAYASSLDIDLGFQGFEAELASLPGRYAPPAGELLLARGPGGAPVGCVALRPLAAVATACEMKRLYVSPEARGIGLGRLLVEAAVSAAKRMGYSEIRLDTLPSMTSAVALYQALGFQRTNPYYDTPVAGTVFMRRSLLA